MDQHLHGLFAQALDEDPGAPPVDLTQAAMRHGVALRRRRRLRIGSIAGGALAATVLALNLTAPHGPSAPRPEPAGLPVPGASRCVPMDKVAIFLKPDATEAQRAGIQATLAADARIRSFAFENREQAYENFVKLWRDSPDFMKSVNPGQLSESFQVTLTSAAEYRKFVAGITGRAGVDQVTPGGCLPHSGDNGNGTAGGTSGEAR